MLDERGKTTHYLAVKEDITERKQTEALLRHIEERLKQSEKMEALGQLAGGIAHDFNNVLTGIIGFAGMSLRHAEQNPVLKNNLVTILKASDRAKKLVQQILTFSRKSDHNHMRVAVRPVVSEVLSLLSVSLPSSMTIVADLDDDTKPVLADPVQIHEIIINLATNAMQAMGNKGTLTVRLYTRFVEKNEATLTGELAQGRYTVIEVADTGCGMDAMTLSKAFEPFYTTKAIGTGTGMGLSVVLGAVKSHGGFIDVDSEVHKGTTFKIYLPAAEGSAAEIASKDNQASLSGFERILFVDDEEMLVSLAVMELTRLGFSVTGMTDSREALSFFKDNPAGIDILITDQTMPDMTGVELAREAFKIRNDIPIILCTGYNSEINPERALANGIKRYIAKPFDLFELTTVIRDILDAPRKEE